MRYESFGLPQTLTILTYIRKDMRCNCNDVSNLKNPSFTKTFPIARDCRYGEVCNGQQRCEVGSGSSVSIQEDLSARFFEEALRRSRRVKRDIDGWQG